MKNINLEDHVADLNIIRRKLSALNTLVHDKLTTAETNAEAKWIKDRFMKKLYEEAGEDFYIIFTILTDIERSLTNCTKIEPTLSPSKVEE